MCAYTIIADAVSPDAHKLSFDFFHKNPGIITVLQVLPQPTADVEIDAVIELFQILVCFFIETSNKASMIELLVEFIQSICLSARFIAGDGFETIFKIYLVLDHLEKRLAQRLRHTDPVDVRIILDEGLLLGGHPERYGHNVVLLCITFEDCGIGRLRPGMGYARSGK